MSEQDLRILDLLPPSDRLSPRSVYISDRARADPEALVQELIDWINFQREQACFPTDELSQEALSLYQAAAYHHNVYNDWHALYFHNLTRSSKLEATLRLAHLGLMRLSGQEFATNLVEAQRLYRDHRNLWNVPRFAGGPPEYQAARSVMKPVDERYVALLGSNDLEELIAAAIVQLPMLTFSSDEELAEVKERLLRSSSRRNERVQELLAQRSRREADREEATRERVRRSLDDDTAFAVEILATMAGYTDVISIEPPVSEEGGPVEMRPVTLRTTNGGAQINYLARGYGKFALLHFDMETIRAAVSQDDIARRRSALLRKVAPAQRSSMGVRGFFGRKR